ncbi:ABC transporter substrate-binding protein [Olivibacter sp. SDN3]|nr:ABC transporter substrate-binding protein [Olivibacter sp. SDN3]
MLLFAVTIFACRSSDQTTGDTLVDDSTRIVSINGSITEILADLGLEDQIVGVDVASTYPKSILQKPKVGHSTKIAAEGVLGLDPDIVIGINNEVSSVMKDQLTSSGVKVLLFDQAYSVEGTKSLIASVTDSLGFKQRGDSIIQALDADLAEVKSLDDAAPKPKVLFIYARGTGTMMVGGDDTQAAKVIELAGGENAITGFADYKPLTAEALVAANPDVILLFSSGLESLGGAKGLLEVQGVKETNAGKNQKFVEMDGQFLTGFSQRLGKAVKELSEKIH